ncbi:hypothetical protein N7495_002022 [Penicillium taxi]|uniref:uncharacterized protein n=1 Tax=Penicillium taxi TaxID=168475 RepID=UPI0025458A1B|nr:uncharacterized protein N7495_002022 [Penicillium taxi]KAJ5901494.1 hypothetical protein N7495_002022 [Penicillium taxi]
MDFAALMSKEISKAKGDTSKSSDAQKDTKAPAKKYMRRGEVEAARVAAYQEEQDRLQQEREERLANKRKLEDETTEHRLQQEMKKQKFAEASRKRREEEEEREERARRRRLGLPDLPEKSEDVGDNAATDAAEEDIEEDELFERLRELDEPTRLFGENHRSRLRRYRRLVLRAATLKKTTDGPIPTILEPVSGGEMIIPAKIPDEKEGQLFLFRQLGSYFNMVLSEWELALAKRDLSVRQSFQGKQAHNALVQSRESMKPLFRRFEQGDLEKGLLEPIVEIVHKAQQRRYVDANDAYLRVSIGKAAWPIGVTQVGIHARSAREKLNQSEQKAHILSDELTRKYLQSIKRCLSFAQVRWPPEDLLQIMG